MFMILSFPFHVYFFVRIHSLLDSLWLFGIYWGGPRPCEWLANTPGDSAVADVCTSSQPRPQNEMSRCSWLFSEKPLPGTQKFSLRAACLRQPLPLQHIPSWVMREYFASDICHQISHTPGRLGPFLSSLHVWNAAMLPSLCSQCCL